MEDKKELCVVGVALCLIHAQRLSMIFNRTTGPQLAISHRRIARSSDMIAKSWGSEGSVCPLLSLVSDLSVPYRL